MPQEEDRTEKKRKREREIANDTWWKEKSKMQACNEKKYNPESRTKHYWTTIITGDISPLRSQGFLSQEDFQETERTAESRRHPLPWFPPLGD